MDIVEVQKLAFRKLISNPKTLPSWLAKVSPEDFALVPLAREVIAAFSVNGNAVHYSPSREYFELLLRDRILDKDRLDSACVILDGVSATPADQSDLDLLIKEMRRWRMCQEMTRIIRYTSEALVAAPENVEKTYDETMRRMQALPMAGAGGLATGLVTEVFDDAEGSIDLYFKEKGQKLQTGLSAIDNATGGFAGGEFTVLMASTGQGKSAIMLWMAYQFLKAGKTVLFITIEMSYEEVMERFNAMTTGLNLRRIRNKTLTDRELSKYIQGVIARSKLDPKSFLKECESIVNPTDKKEALEIGARYRNRREKFFILDIPRNCSPARIEKEIARLSIDDPIDAVFVDYLNIMEPNFHSKDKIREQASIAQDLKGVFRKLKVVGVVGAQMNAPDDEDGKLSIENTRYCKAIAENCDWQLAFHRSTQDKIMRQLRITLTKHRHSDEVTNVLETDFDTMQFRDLGNEKDVPQPEKTEAQKKQESRPQWT